MAFMVPAAELGCRAIGRGARHIPLGTKVRADVLTNDPDTLFPLRAALGYELTQSLFVGENTLLVEGVGGILYIQTLSDALRQMKCVVATTLDTAEKVFKVFNDLLPK